MNWSKYADASEEDMKYMQSGTDEQFNKQREAIEAAYNQTQEAADALKKKSQNAMIAAIGFGLAAAELSGG